jgi:hypothetical protein
VVRAGGAAAGSWAQEHARVQTRADAEARHGRGEDTGRSTGRWLERHGTARRALGLGQRSAAAYEVKGKTAVRDDYEG